MYSTVQKCWRTLQNQLISNDFIFQHLSDPMQLKNQSWSGLPEAQMITSNIPNNL